LVICKQAIEQFACSGQLSLLLSAGLEMLTRLLVMG